MPADSLDVKQVAEELGARFTEFKQKNDKRLEAIESEKSKLGETVDSMNGQLTELDKQKTALEDEIAQLKRPGGMGGVDKTLAAHKQAFDSWFRKGQDDGLLDLQSKAMSVDSDPDGGFLVPDDVDNEITRVLTDMGAMRSMATVRKVGGAVYKKLVSHGGATSGWVGERETREETSTPKLSPLEFPTQELYAEPMVTQSILEDASFNVESWLGDEVSLEFSEQESKSFIDGDGNKKPLGILGYGSVANENYKWGKVGHIKSGANGGFVVESGSDALINLVHSLRRGFRQNANFLMNDLTLAEVRKLKDKEGNYLWRPGLGEGVPSSLLGYGVENDDFMPDIASDALSIAFADFKRAYVITDRRGTQVLRDPYTQKPYVKFYTTRRVGGGVQNFEAIKLLKFSA